MTYNASFSMCENNIMWNDSEMSEITALSLSKHSHELTDDMIDEVHYQNSYTEKKIKMLNECIKCQFINLS